MLFNLLLASITVLLFLLFFLVTFNSFFIIPVFNDNIKVKEALANPPSIPITLIKEIIPFSPLVADETIRVLLL